MTAPCAIAIAIALESSPTWRETARTSKIIATLLLCLGLVVVSTQWPIGIWSDYRDSTKLGLPGTALMRVDPTDAANIQYVTQTLRSQCDTFLAVPNENSFYIFTGILPLTGLLVDRPEGLDVAQQTALASLLEAKTQANERVCILRDYVRLRGAGRTSQ